MKRGPYKTFAGRTRSDRFRANISIAPAGCWEWLGTKTKSGYGQMRWAGKKVYAHRYSLELAGRAPEPSQVVCHTCDNPGCVNPLHLFVGTQKDNMGDAALKGRTLRKKLSATCRRGHRLSGKNVTWLTRAGYPRPLRRCRACARMRASATISATTPEVKTEAPSVK